VIIRGRSALDAAGTAFAKRLAMALIPRRSFASLHFIAALLVALPLAAQTKITAPKNKYSPQQDVQIGREAAAEVRKEYPILRQGSVDDLVDEVGGRLVAEIPGEFRQPAFQYSFDVVNMSDINAFALPGGPMFLNRGMIEAARSDAEVAGVMAHELSHVILRHGTAQATKGQPFQIGAIAGQIVGAIIGGRTGQVIASGSELGLGAWFLKYGRDYERQADLLGAQIMARAGYDPRQMANMFRTIQKQGGNRGPEWLSSHPDPGDRYDAINREASMLRVEGQADTADEFQSARASLSRMAPAPSAEQLARAQQQGRDEGRTVGTAARSARIDPPSSRWRTYQPAGFLRLAVPENWQQVSTEGSVTYAPEGGYDRAAFTHGLQIGVTRQTDDSLQSATDQLVRGFAQSNPRLRRDGGYSQTTVDGRRGLTTTLSNVSDATGRPEAIALTTVKLRDGSVLYILGVAPADEARVYFNAFSRARQSLQLGDR
jgi:predicted Zn-dependent protease